MVMTDGTDDIQVEIRGQKLESVSNFVYLGSKLSRGNDLGPEVARRIGLAAAAFGLLRNPLWKNLRSTRKRSFKCTKQLSFQRCFMVQKRGLLSKRILRN